MTGIGHERAAGSLCTDDGTGCCVECGVEMSVCDVCGGIGYHRDLCPESDERALDHCYFCHGAYGECTCTWPHPDDPGAEVLFVTRGMAITAPNMSDCGRFFVNPVHYYGAPYLAWLRSRNPPLTRRSCALARRIQGRCAAAFGMPVSATYFGHNQLPGETPESTLLRLFYAEQRATGWGESAVIDALVYG